MTSRASGSAPSWCRIIALGTVVGGTACSDPAPPESAVAAIVLSVADTGATIGFRDQLVVRASPQAALGVPLQRAIAWSSVTPALLSVQPLNANGDSARIQAVAVGRGEIRVAAGAVTKSFPVTVQDTVFSVTLTPRTLSLIAGDTASLVATVPGPPNAIKALRWEVSNANVLQMLPSLDSMTFRFQMTAAGATSVSAKSLADTTKVATAAIVSQQGRLGFLVPPSNVARETPFSPGIAVVVRDALGNVSTRAANAITLALVAGTCGASLDGAVTENASDGIAVFRTLSVNARCPAAMLTASASPPASSATSQPFSIDARSCTAVAPLGLTGTVNALVESVDCLVMRGGKPMYVHTYEATVPLSTPWIKVFVDVVTSAFAPRVESYLWAQEPGAGWPDSVLTTGTLSSAYVLGPGSYRLSITSPAPLGTGAYTVRTRVVGGEALCNMRTTTNISFNNSFNTVSGCTFPFASRAGEGRGVAYIVYLPAGKKVTASYRSLGGNTDAYIEVFDVTSPSSPPILIAFDDNSGGGTTGTDAQLQVLPALTGRFLEIRALVLNFNTGAFYNLTIQP